MGNHQCQKVTVECKKCQGQGVREQFENHDCIKAVAALLKDSENCVQIIERLDQADID